MKDNFSIIVDKISKVYDGQKTTYTTLRDKISLKNFSKKEDKNNFYALKDISFKIKKGEVVGVIGKNGSGKSTLLKILSKITNPTSGKAYLSGSVSSLLEVGTGFNLELSGKENIYLNGSILGLSKHEIDKRFKDIVNFSGVGSFINLPAKRYSSGMLVRLAFSVATFLNAEILLIDEVLAVGDQEFREKSTEKMSEIVKSGRTILFVSHNLNIIKNLCSKVILLDRGKVKKIGSPAEVISEYLDNNRTNNKNVSKIKNEINNLKDDKDINIKNVSIKQNGKEKTKIENSENINLEISYLIKNNVSNLRIYFDLITKDGSLVLRSFSDEVRKIIYKKEKIYLSKAILPSNLFAPGEYYLDIKATVFNERACFGGDSIRIPIRIVHTSKYNKNYPNEPIRGLIAPIIKWETK